jgi:hypothetical protein
MKSFCVILLLGIALIGCVDKTSSPIAPTDQQMQGQGVLEKRVITNFTFSHNPIAPPFGGTVRLVPGGKWQLKEVGVKEKVISTDPLVSGIMVHYLSATLDAVTGEGPVHGTLTITPEAAVGGGVWEGTYEGYRSKMPGSDKYFTLPLKAVAHGRGGTIDGMQLTETSIITAWGTPPEGWYGGGDGFYKAH